MQREPRVQLVPLVALEQLAQLEPLDQPDPLVLLAQRVQLDRPDPPDTLDQLVLDQLEILVPLVLQVQLV